MGGIIVVKFDQEIGKIGAVFAPDAVDELLGAQAILLGAQHDRRAVSVIRANVVAFVAAQLLKADPDVGLNVFHQVADVNRAVGVGQGAGDENAADRRVAHGADSCGRSERPLR